MSAVDSDKNKVETVDAEIVPNSDEDLEPSMRNKSTIVRGKKNKMQEQHSTQENKQDMDQEQNVDVKPAQINVQTLEVSVNNKIENYSGKITGVVYKEDGTSALPHAELQLFFGSSTQYPVQTTKTDDNGNFHIADLPPGYYTLKVLVNKSQRALVVNIKVLPGENSYQSVLLEKEEKKESVNSRKQLYSTW